MARCEPRGDAGQAVPLAVAMMALVVVALVALVPAAAANGAEVMAFTRAGGEVVVRVRVGDVEAEARARGRRNPPPPPVVTGTAGGRAGLSPELTVALARADALLGYP